MGKNSCLALTYLSIYVLASFSYQYFFLFSWQLDFILYMEELHSTHKWGFYSEKYAKGGTKLFQMYV